MIKERGLVNDSYAMAPAGVALSTPSNTSSSGRCRPTSTSEGWLSLLLRLRLGGDQINVFKHLI